MLFVYVQLLSFLCVYVHTQRDAKPLAQFSRINSGYNVWTKYARTVELRNVEWLRLRSPLNVQSFQRFGTFLVPIRSVELFAAIFTNTLSAARTTYCKAFDGGERFRCENIRTNRCLALFT